MSELAPFGNADAVDLFFHLMLMSFLAVGGLIATVPEMHRYLVDQHHWLTHVQFNTAVTMGQAAPGPNILFVALFGWNIGMDHGGEGFALFLAILCMVAVLIPGLILIAVISGWMHKNRELRSVKAFKAGLSPLVVALLVTTGYLLASNHSPSPSIEGLWALVAVAFLLAWKTRIPVLAILALGGILGALGWV
jgi:chromate transporter